MSTNYDLYCVDCEAYCGFTWNHGNEELAAIWKVQEQFLAFHYAMILAGIDTEVIFHHSLSQYGFATFARQHGHHNVKPKDEYGRFDDQCHGRTKCGHCGSSHHCTLKLNHEGECKANDKTTEQRRLPDGTSMHTGIVR